jgi:predicted outer membrane protein
MMKALILAASLAALPALAQDNAPPQQNAPQGASTATPEVRAARQAMRQACAPDAATFCKDVQPGGGKIMACLREHRTELSAGCQAAWQNVRAARGASH